MYNDLETMYENKGEYEKIDFLKSFDYLDELKRILNDYEFNRKRIGDNEEFKELKKISLFNNETLVDDYDDDIENLIEELKKFEKNIESVTNSLLDTDMFVKSKMPKE